MSIYNQNIELIENSNYSERFIKMYVNSSKESKESKYSEILRLFLEESDNSKILDEYLKLF